MEDGTDEEQEGYHSRVFLSILQAASHEIFRSPVLIFWGLIRPVDRQRVVHRLREVEPGEPEKQKQQKALKGKDEQRTANEQKEDKRAGKQNCVKTSIAVAVAKRVCC